MFEISNEMVVEDLQSILDFIRKTKYLSSRFKDRKRTEDFWRGVGECLHERHVRMCGETGRPETASARGEETVLAQTFMCMRTHALNRLLALCMHL